MINAKEFEREFYSPMYEDMVKLREIWVACGKPDPDVRADDAKRMDAITQAASALHWTVSLAGKSTSLGALAKWMLQYTRHAWQEDEACYNAVLQVCKDYEEGRLWYSATDYNKWLTYAEKHQLDSNTNVRAERRRMERLWLRPLSQVPKQQYLDLANDMAARHLVDGRRPQQKYFFGGARAVAPKKHTLAWVVDWIQRREAVRNVLRWLIVKSGGERPTSMTEFFEIDVGRFGGKG
jgi:hypothetical protein